MGDVTFKEATLPNGLRVIAEIIPGAKSAAVGYFVNTGSRDELAGEEGISHFLEHMVFKGTEKRSAAQVNREFDGMGAKYNAFTNEEMTVFYGAVLPEFVPRLLALLTDLMQPAIRPDDFESERQVILEEIALYRDRPDAVLFERLQRSYFGVHPLAKPVLGTPESIARMTPESMRDYHARRYVPGNMTLAFAGKVEWQEVLALAEAMTADWRRGHVNRNHPSFSPNSGLQRDEYEKAQQFYLAAASPGVSARDEARYAARVLAAIIGDADNGRLYWRLIDSGLAETAATFHQEFDDLGAYYFYVQGNPQNEEAIVAALYEEIGRLVKRGVGEDELERARLKTATSLVFAGEAALSRLFYLGVSYGYTGRYEPLDAVRRWVLHLQTYHLEELLEGNPFADTFEYRLVPIGA